MTAPGVSNSRLRAYLEFLAAVIYYFVARSIARHSATGMASDAWYPLVEQAVLVVLLLFGFSSFGYVFDRQKQPVSEQGFPLRQGWIGEVALGVSIGWAIAVVCVLPLALFGGIAIVLSLQLSAWGWLLADAVFFALAALAEEIAFRGYGFQRFNQSVGGIGAALGFAVFYAIVQAVQPGANHASLAVSIAFSLLLSTVYLRTRALWLSWGLNFAWKASRALLFGLAVSGVNSHSPVVEGDPMGSFWLTGGGFGLDGSWVTFVVLLLAIPVVYRLTRELDYRHNAPVIVPGGIPVDLDAAARLQHEAAMGPAEPSAAPALIQIAPANTPPVSPPRQDGSPDVSTDSHAG
jgi:membrane protease YdiL (CAAX protease family)